MRLVISGLFALLLLLPAPVHARTPIEDYAPYDPSPVCHRTARPGTEVLARWIVRRFGGAYGNTVRACPKDGHATSEHQNGRAFDWTVDVLRPADRKRVRWFLHTLFQRDRYGNRHVIARRMGVMYIIWDDEIYSASDLFEPRPYLASECRRLKGCSRTLRHRDHVHISLSRDGAMARTSWYAGRL